MTYRSDAPGSAPATRSATDPGAPLISPPPPALLRCAAEVETPALIYDIPGVYQTIRRLQGDIEDVVPDSRLNIALKACHTPAVLARFAAWGLGCDVASVGELELALATGFTEISVTGPAFSTEDFARFRAAGVVPDVDSVSQLEKYGAAFPGSDVGLRIRIPFPKQLQSPAMFGADSRFGVSATDPEVGKTVVRYGLRVTRLHVHTGQMIPEALLFKTRYLLTVAEHYRDVVVIDLGGGFYHLYADRRRAAAAFRQVAAMVSEWRQRHGRELHLRFEPGAALLGPYGYLVAEVRAVEDRHPEYGCRLVTVNSSAWNLAPWHRPQVVPLYSTEAPPEPVRIAGNTLYENDFFGLGVRGDQHPLALPKPKVGDRILLTAAGAYTMTNSRRFNRIPPPREYLFDGASLTEVSDSVADLAVDAGYLAQEVTAIG